MSVFVLLSTALAGVLLIYRLINWKHFIHNKFLWLALAFLVSYGISMVWNMRYGIATPVKTMAWMGMQYLLLFATDDRKKLCDHKKQFHILSGVYIAYMFIAAAISISFLFTKYSNIAELKTEAGVMYIKSGFVWGRLWGVFTDPNYGSVMATIALLLSLYFILNSKRIAVKIIMGINIALQVIYVCFSDSRTGLVAICVSVGVATYCLLFTRKFKFGLVAKNAVCILMALVVVIGYVGLSSGMKDGYNKIIQTKINSVIEDEGEEEEFEEQLVGREQDLENDISNRRFDLWGASFEILGSSPVVGVSFNNIQKYTLDNFPENYLVNNDHGKFDNYHNVLFNILAGQGLLGLALFIALGAWAGIAAIKAVQKNLYGKENIFYIMAFSVLLAALCGSMFVSDLVYVNSPTATIFWYLLGVILIKPEKEVQ